TSSAASPIAAAPRSQPLASSAANAAASPASPVPAASGPAAPTKPASFQATASPSSGRTESNLKDALLTEIKRAKTVFYNTVVAQAQKIEVAGDRVTFTFSPNHRTLRDVFEQNRAWIESAAQQVSGRRVAVISVQSDGTAAAKESAAAATPEKESA